MIRRGAAFFLMLGVALHLGGDTRQRPGFLGVGFTHHKAGGEQWLTVRIVVPGAPGQAAGIRVGDVITAIDGKRLQFAHLAAVMDFLERVKPQQRVELTTVRAGKTRRHVLTAIRMPDDYWERWQVTRKVARERAAKARQ